MKNVSTFMAVVVILILILAGQGQGVMRGFAWGMGRGAATHIWHKGH